MNRSSHIKTAGIFSIYGVFFVWLFLFLLPLCPSFPASSLDPSHKYAIDYALTHGLRFGSEICFTFGPLGSFFLPEYYYNPSTYGVAVGVSLGMIGAIFLGFIVVLSGLDGYQKSLGCLAIMVGSTMGGTFIWNLIPLLWVGVCLKGYSLAILKRISIVGLLALMSFSVLIKFSHFPGAFLSVVGMDLYLLYKKGKRVPFNTILFFVGMVIIFGLSGQHLLDYPAYFKASLQILAGYSDAMQSDGPIGMIALFIVLLVGMILVLARSLLKERTIENHFFALVAGIVLLMAFKNGFVRHDVHAIAAFSGLAVVFGMLFVWFAPKRKDHAAEYALFSMIVAVSIMASIEMRGHYVGQPSYTVIGKKWTAFTGNATAWPRLLSSSRLAILNRQYEASIRAVIEECPLGDLSGTVDIYPWDQAFVLANGLDYRPRPVFQSYSVYTPALIRKNKAFLDSERAPQTILFALKEIDGRLPALMEGGLWLDLMRWYQGVDIKGEFLVLKRSARPLACPLLPIEKKICAFNESVRVPPGHKVFAEITINKSFAGKIANILFKVPHVYIELFFVDQPPVKYRLIPGISSSGFILSPALLNIHDFLDFSVGKDVARSVTAFRISTSREWLYHDPIEVVFKQIDTQEFSDGLADRESNPQLGSQVRE